MTPIKSRRTRQRPRARTRVIPPGRVTRTGFGVAQPPQEPSGVARVWAVPRAE